MSLYAKERPGSIDNRVKLVLLNIKKPQVDAKELRVKIAVDYHLKLHALKLLRGKNMSEAVEEALAHYFDIMRIKDEELAMARAGAAAELPTEVDTTAH